MNTAWLCCPVSMHSFSWAVFMHGSWFFDSHKRLIMHSMLLEQLSNNNGVLQPLPDTPTCKRTSSIPQLVLWTCYCSCPTSKPLRSPFFRFASATHAICKRIYNTMHLLVWKLNRRRHSIHSLSQTRCLLSPKSQPSSRLLTSSGYSTFRRWRKCRFRNNRSRYGSGSISCGNQSNLQ